MALGGLWWGVFCVSRQLFLVFVWRRIGGDEFWARIEEKLFKGRKAVITIGSCRGYLVPKIID